MKFLRRLRFLFGRRRAEADMAEEMRFHLENRAADFAEDGATADEAECAARRKFGNLGSIQERAREVHGWGGLERALKDVRFALRHLAKSPGFTLLAIVTLALGIGANTSMFSALNSILLKPLPYPETEQLFRIDRVSPQDPASRISPADFLDFRREGARFGEVAGYALGDTSLSEPGQPADIARALRTTANFFGTLRMPMQIGRDFRADEETPGHDRVVILSQRTWLNRFGGRADIIGRSVRIDGAPHEIIGVLPASFNDWRHLGVFDLYRPLAFDAEAAADRHTLKLRIIARRSPTMAANDGDALIANFGARMASDHPTVNAGTAWRAVPLVDTVLTVVGSRMLPTIVGLSGFVLLIACSNLANLMLARTLTRAREFAVRSALGASRLQLLRPLVVESLVLSLAGGALALIVALWFQDWGAMRSTGENGEQVVLALDLRVLAWAFGISLVTALAFGTAPALFALRLDLNQALKTGGRGLTGSRGHQHLRHALIVGQFALALILLAGAAVFIHGLHELTHRRSGWSSDQLVIGTIMLPAAGYPSTDRVSDFHRRSLERLEALPGVGSASLASFSPFNNWSAIRRFVVEGQAPPKPGHEPSAAVNSVTSRYFATVGTPLIVGRTFSERDDASSPRVFIISQSMATALFGSANPLGARLVEPGGASAPGEIVGVVTDVRPALAEPGSTKFQIYQPMAQNPSRQSVIVLRAERVAPASLVADIRAAMTSLDPDLPVRSLRPADVSIHRNNYQLRVLRDILIALATLGLALATLGIYGVVARTMAQRTHEFAIRLALGACVRDINRLLLTTGVKLALCGAALGLIGAWVVIRTLSTGFPGMEFRPSPVLFGTVVFLIGVAVIACWLPARRAGKVDAMQALRSE
jgi:putative ABC transport system permease protein